MEGTDMRNTLRILFAAILFTMLLSHTAIHAANWKVIYSEDFSADPGWTTDQPTNFYWESGTGTYFIRTSNTAEAYEPNRYTHKIITAYTGGAFKLEWDIQMISNDWSAGIGFGMYDSQLSYLPRGDSAHISGELGIADQGHYTSLRTHQGTNSSSTSFYMPSWEFAPVWYHCVLENDPKMHTIKLTVYNRNESTLFASTMITNAPTITNDIKYLGSSRYPIGHPPYNGGIDPGAIAEGRIDNVVLSVEDPFCKGNFDYDKDVDGSDASMFKSNFGRSALVNPCPPDGPAPVPRTWQTIPYADFDDGYFQKGVVLPSPRFTDNSNGTVTDNLTGLIWLKNANCFGVRTWDQAISDCNGLASGSCGLTDGSMAGDWRLPNRFELDSLFDLAYTAPALSNAAGTGQWTEGDPFNALQPDGGYWSSTTLAYDTTYAWGVGPFHGYDAYSTKTSSFLVWPVRGGR
jgi:hypothetical protein